jgi:hypothetical protein
MFLFKVTKRACSAPPVELIGKQVVLQRMELKSPLTVQQNAPVVPYDQSRQSQLTSLNPNQYYLHANNRSQTPLILNRQAYYTNPTRSASSRVSNLKSSSLNRNGFNNLESSQQLIEQQQQQQQLQQQQRNVFLNRAYSETPRITNGYETDSGIASSYKHPHSTANGSDVTGYAPSSTSTHPNTGHSVNNYRTLGPSSIARYNRAEQHASGYDTDTGLVRLRQVLESGKHRGAATIDRSYNNTHNHVSNANHLNNNMVPLQTMPNG